VKSTVLDVNALQADYFYSLDMHIDYIVNE